MPIKSKAFDKPPYYWYNGIMIKFNPKISNIFLMMIFFLIPFSCFSVWLPVGIGGGGAQYAPSISPLNPNLRFVGSDMSGWYRSADGGNNWCMLDFYQISANVDYGFNQGFMCAMAYNPSDPNIIYGYGAQQDSQNNPPQLLVSNDAGVTWSVLNAAPAWGASRVTVIYLDRANANLMLVGTEAGVYTSTDAGASFSGPGGSGGYIHGLMIDQSSPAGNRVCYAGSWDNGIYRSADNGATWAVFNTGLPSTNSLSFCGASTAAGSRLFDIDGNNYYIYTSTNGGAWTLSSNADSFSMLACADSDTSSAYSTIGSDRSIWKTANGGTSWNRVFTDSSPAPNASLGWISYDLSFSWGAPNTMIGACGSDSSKVMFTNLGETILSNDGGATWQEAYSTYSDTAPRAAAQKWASRGLEMTNAWHYEIDPNNQNYHYICYTDIGFARSTDAGLTWYDTARKGTASQNWTNTFYQIAFNPTAGTILAAVGGLHDIDHSWPLGRAGSGGVVKSINYGTTWAPSSTGLPVSPTTSIVFDPVNNIYFAASWGNGVYKSTDATGSSWAACAPVAIGTNHDVYSLKISGGKLYCLLSAQKSYTNAGGLFVSANQGATWTNIALNFGGHALKYPTDFDVNPLDPNIIFIASQDGGGYADGGLWKTINGGTSWAAMAMPVGHTPYGFAPSIDPGNTNNVYFSTENQGLFKSPDSGLTWARVTGIPFASIQRMKFDTNFTYVTTFGGGVWKEAVGTPAATPVQTQTNTSTFTATRTPVNTPTFTQTKTITATTTPAITQTFTCTLTITETASVTGTPTVTDTVNPAWTVTDTPTQSPTFTISDTFTQTSTVVLTLTFTASETAVPTQALTALPTATITQTIIPMPTPVWDEKLKIEDTVIYPNPCNPLTSGLNIKMTITRPANDMKVRIYTVSFRLILEEYIGAVNTQGYTAAIAKDRISRLSPGIYYMVVTARADNNDIAVSKAGVLVILK